MPNAPCVLWWFFEKSALAPVHRRVPGRTAYCPAYWQRPSVKSNIPSFSFMFVYVCIFFQTQVGIQGEDSKYLFSRSLPWGTEGGLRPAHQPKFPVTQLILNVLIQLKNNAKSDYTIKFVDKSLKYIERHADLNEPEQVKQFIANLQASDSYKKNLCFAYNTYCCSSR